MNFQEKVMLASIEASIRERESSAGIDSAVDFLAQNNKDFIRYFVLKTRQLTELYNESWWNAVTNTGDKAKIMYICEEVVANYFGIDKKDFYRRRASDKSKMESKFSGTDAVVCLLYGILFRVFSFSIPNLQENYDSNVKNYRDRWSTAFDNIVTCESPESLTEKEKVMYDAMKACMPIIKDKLIEAKVWSQAYDLYVE